MKKRGIFVKKLFTITLSAAMVMSTLQGTTAYAEETVPVVSVENEETGDAGESAEEYTGTGIETPADQEMTNPQTQTGGNAVTDENTQNPADDETDGTDAGISSDTDLSEIITEEQIDEAAEQIDGTETIETVETVDSGTDYMAWAQSDSRWGSLTLGSSGQTVSSIGCLATVTTKIIIQAGLQSSDSFNVATFVNWMNSNSGFTSDGAMYWGKPEHYGLSNSGNLLSDGTYSSSSYNSQLLTWIKNGYHLAINVKSGGHWVGVDEAKSIETGTIYIMDSLSNTSSNTGVTLADRYSTFNRVHAYTGGTTPTGGSSSSDYVDVGTGFYAYLVFTYPWKELGLSDTNVQTENTVENSDHIWYFERQSNGSYKITNAYNGKCLDVYNAGGSGSNVQVYDSNDSSAQRWYITGYSSCYQLHPACATDCSLDVSGSNYDENLNVQIWTTNNSTAQNFQIYLADENLGSSEITTSVSAGKLTVNWTTKAYADYYNVRVFKDTNYTGTDYTQWCCTGNTLTMELPEGHYYVYVDCGNSLICKQSNIVEVDIRALPTGTQTVSDGDYMIMSNTGSQRVVTVASASSDDGANVQLWDGINYEPFVFTVTYLGDGYYSIVSRNSGKALDITNGNMDSGSNVQQWTQNSNDWQKWVIRADSSGQWFNIISKYTALYLTVAGSVDADGTNICAATGDGSSGQQWRFVPYGGDDGQTIADGSYHIESANSAAFGRVAAVYESATYDGANIHLSNYTGNDNEIFDVKYLGNGYYKITSKNSGLSLDAANDYVSPGTNLQQCQYWGNTFCQQWIIRSCGDGYYNVICRANGLYMDLLDGVDADGQNIRLYLKNGANAEKWKFVPADTSSMQMEEKGSVAYNGSLYKIYTASDGTELNWWKAKEWCEQNGGHLACITSAAENQAVASMVSAYGSSCWIGGSDNETEGTFSWITGETFSYTNWSANEPNDQGGAQDYMQMYKDGTWDDTSLDASLAFIYERSCPNITLHPEDTSVVAGETFVFDLLASGSGLTYLWQYSTDNGATWVDTTRKKNTYTTTATTAMNGRLYRCIVTNSEGVSVTSNPAKLTVTSPIAITVQPAATTVVAGTTFVIKVTAKSLTGSTLTYLWQYSKDNGSTWTNTTRTINNYSTTATTAMNGRLFRCVIKDADGYSLTSDPAELIVKPSIEITAQPTATTVDVGEKFTFKVTAKSNTGSKLSYLWQYSKTLKGWTDTTRTVNNYGTYATVGVDGKYFRCKITDEAGNVVYSEPAMVRVLSDITITQQPVNTTVANGKRFYFTVTATGSSLTYLWQYSTDGGSTWIDTTRTKNNYTTYAKTAMSGRRFRCVITDSSGNSVISDEAKLMVR